MLGAIKSEDQQNSKRNERNTYDNMKEYSKKQPTKMDSTEADLTNISLRHRESSGDSPEYTEAMMNRSILDVVFGQTSINAAISPLTGTLTCVALWTSVAHERLLVWLGALLAVMVIRYSVVVLFKYHVREDSLWLWNWVFGGTLILPALVWGVGTLFILPGSSPFHETIVYLFLFGMAGGTALGYSALKPAAIISLVIFLGPLTLKFFLTPDIAFRSMAVGGTLLIIIGSASILRLGGFIRRSFEYSYKLDAARKTAEDLARVDHLTGIFNRRAFYEMGDYLISQARRNNHPLSLLLIDVDHFKQINDTFGHATGDAVLRSQAGSMKQSCRAVDVVGRLGGDEFAILLPGDDSDQAVEYASRLRKIFSECEELTDDVGGRITCSIGVATLARNMDLDHLIHAADIALYDSKQEGRDRISR